MSCAVVHPRIRVLPPQIANQIAAGEVVERPASVVKELLENSLDARARSIDVEIEAGGVQRIYIRDDGHGIHHDDLVLALSPHATSKIISAADLDGVCSLGFRGEALASIASVSRFSLGSRLVGDAHGWRVTSEMMEVAPAPVAAGTEVEVRDLFYNTPARRKFLRSERTELGHVEEVVRRIALSRFDLAVRFSHNGKQLLRVKGCLPGVADLRRVADVLGTPFAENSIAVDVTAGGVRLWGWIGRQGYSRSQADIHYFYLNGRMIRDRLASHAVRLAFGEAIPEGRYPAYLLYLELDPHLVDVNVHPTKHEVRFREARQVHDFIYWAISGALRENDDPIPVSPATPQEPVSYAREYRSSLRSTVGELSSVYATHRGRTAVSAARSDAPLGQAVCQLRNGYLLAERGDATLIVDLRTMLRELNHWRLAVQGGDFLVTQPLLVPESQELTVPEAQLWRERGAALQPYGFEFGWFGDTLLVLRKVPAIVRSASIPALLEALQVWLAQREAPETARESMYQILSASAVPERLPAYALSELNGLLREFEAINPSPLLRPWRELASGDWQRLFEIFP